MSNFSTNAVGGGNADRVFFGYPSRPETQRETLLNATRSIAKVSGLHVVSWEGLRISGKIVISSITREIDNCNLAVFDVTSLNHNVMFELGYAIGAKKLLWLIRDVSVKEDQQLWNRVKLLTPIGYREYKNSDHITNLFFQDRPLEQSTTIFQELLEPSFLPLAEPQLFYMKLNHETEADRILSRRIDEERTKGFRLTVDDATESKVQPLSWYARQVYGSGVVLAHLSGPTRRDAEVHNARAAFVCGIAVALKRQVLMLCEEGQETPFDYQHLLFEYRSARSCLEMADSWLLTNDVAAVMTAKKHQQVKPSLALKTELQGLRLGEYVAENEEQELEDYFLDTTSFQEVLERKTTVFVGSKGTGKTANLLQAAKTLARDKRNLVVLVKPAGYELSNLSSLLKKYRNYDSKGYLIESLWKFLLYSELAWAAIKAMRDEAILPDTPEWLLREYLTDRQRGLDRDFAVRLERAVEALNKVPEHKTLEESRFAIAEAMHEGVLRELRLHLGNVLKDKQRVAILIDNLDKAWEKGSDLDLLCEMLLGLLATIGRVAVDFKKSDSWRQPVEVTLAVFIRSDIYARVASIAREPDKIPTTRLTWQDPEVLLRVIENRFCSTRDYEVDSAILWDKFFCRTVRNVTTKEYLTTRVLPRPRDIVYLCSAAINNAVNRGHSLVEEQDVLDAEKTYSQFAFEALQVSNGINGTDLERVLYEFVGVDAILAEERLLEILKNAELDPFSARKMIEFLCSTSFLGIELRNGEFQFTDDPRIQARNFVVAKKLAEARKQERNYQIHPAFRTFLEIGDSKDRH